MHPCLFIEEILSRIFGMLSLDGRSKELAYLARTCRVFTGSLFSEEPALDALWYEIEALAPVVKSMPPDLWMEEDEILTFRRQLLEEDWVKFDYYAHRIRVFGCAEDLSTPLMYGIHKDVLLSLSTYEPAKTLFPNVHTIHQHTEDSLEVAGYIQIFLGPMVQNIKIVETDSLQSPTPDSFWDAFLKRSSSIRHLDVEECTGLSASFFNMICGLRNLSHLFLSGGALTDDAITHFGALGTLKILSHVHIPTSQIPKYIKNKDFLSNLERLSFVTSDWSSAATLLNGVQHQFTALCITCNELKEPISSFALFVESIIKHPSQLSLRELSLTGPKVFLNGGDNNTTVVDTFRLLFGLTALWKVHLISPLITQLNNSWLSGAALAWPLLRDLNVSSDTTPRKQSKISLTGLIPVIQHCPQLQELTMDLRLKAVDPPLLNSVCNLSIRKFTFGLRSVMVGQPQPIIRSLIRMFPNLNYIEHPFYSERWRKLSNLLYSLNEEEEEEWDD